LIYERGFSSAKLLPDSTASVFDVSRRAYPRFLVTDQVKGFGIPIRENYHDILYPDLWNPRQPDLFSGASRAERPSRPGNTIRKVYLCRAPSNLGEAGSVLFFYKSASKEAPSQAMTAIGVLESIETARSTRDLMQLTGGRSVYSEQELAAWDATPEHPVKVINYLLVAYIDPPIDIRELRSMGVIKQNPQQSIYSLTSDQLQRLLNRANLGFQT
jgi:hypothetical protein